MHPWPTDRGNSQLPTQVHPLRSWTEARVPPTGPSANPPNTYGARSASFSGSRSSFFPNWNDLPPPPPLPPLPPSLLPGFRSPPLAHSDRDIFFVDNPPLQSPQQWTHASPELPQGFVHPSSNHIPNSAPLWPPQRSFRPPTAPPLGPPPVTGTHTNDYTPPVETERITRPMSSALEQRLYMKPVPPPAVPPRPMTTHGEVRVSGASSAPPVPPRPSGSLPPSSPSNSAPPPTPSKDWLQSSTNLQFERSEPVKELVPSLSNPYSDVTQPKSGHSRARSAEDVARAIELSLAESQKGVFNDKKLQDEEDHDLQRALTDSLVESRLFVRPDPGADVPHTFGESSSTGEAISVVAVSANRDIEVEAQQSQRERDGKAALRRLMEQEERRLAEEKRMLEQRDEEMARRQAEEEEQAQKQLRQEQERRDAEMARRLANAEKGGPSILPMSVLEVNSISVSNSTPVSQHQIVPAPTSILPQEASSQPPPLYDDVVTSAPVIPSKQTVRPHPSKGSMHSTSAPPVASTSPATRGRTTSVAVSPTATSAVPPQEHAQFSRASSVEAGASVQAGYATKTMGDSTSSQSILPKDVASPTAMGHAGARPHGHPFSLEEKAETRRRPSSGSAGPSQASSVHASQDENLELELLRGVSFGFEPPDTPLALGKHSQLPPCRPFPEVISLHPAPERPFHIMALSWRHLMRVLANFETRIEASVRAIAASKQEPILRVVIQFLKLPYTTHEWRTVIHLSVDQPVPQNTPQVWRYTNGDTTVLPYSIALGETPAHLRISAISHVYAVPLSPTTQFPILPLALPNLALYLQSAMRDSRSRKVQNDTTNTMRRLARIVSSCYPEEVTSAESEERESGRGVGGLFKRVVGRGGAKRRDTQGNEDVCDMVTPFRIDKYTPVA